MNMLTCRAFGGAALAALIISGCASPQIAIDRTEEMADYSREVYLVELKPDKDPRNVFPKVAEGLQRIGFQVTQLSEDSPLLGNQGTAFALSESGYFLSSAHIFEKTSEATLWLDGTRMEASVVKKDEDADLALLKVGEGSLPVVPLVLARDSVYRMGMEVFTIGFPLSDVLGRQPRLNQGLVSASVGLKGDPDYVQVTVETQPGNSGSPLLNRDREVIGIMQGTLNAADVMRATGGAAPQNVNFALKLSGIESFLAEEGIVLAAADEDREALDFETVSLSIAQVRSGIITDELIDSNKLGCFVLYHSIWDIWPRFVLFHLVFFDLDTRDVVLVAGQTGDNMASTENMVIQRTLEEVRQKLILTDGE